MAALLLVGALAACSGDDATEDQGERGHDGGDASTDAASWPDGGPTLGPLVSGTTSIVEGTYVWTDHAYDDRGANTDDGDRTVLDDAGGDAAYPEPLSNAADLIQLQVGTDGDALEVTAVFETLVGPDVPALVVGFDTDGDASTGAAALPLLDWAPSEPLGLEHVAVLSADGAHLVHATPEGVWEHGGDDTPDVEVDPDENVLRAVLAFTDEGPLPFSRPGAGDRWRAVAATTLADELDDDVGGEPGRPGTATTYDLAFVGDEPPYLWQEHRQADVLAGKAPPDLGTGIGAIDGAVLGDESVTEVDLGREPGFHTYLYRSELALDEGIASTEDGLEYLGPYQPYLVWIGDDGWEPDQPISVFLHGLQQNHLGSVAPGGAYLGTARALSEEVHQLAQYAVDGVDFPPHSTTVWPLARGEALGYQGIAEQDVLDVLADASLRLQPDEDRVVLQGASMGGIGAFRLAARHPDLWSAVVPIIGFAPDETEPLLSNLTNVPIRQINGVDDPLIDAARAEATTDLLGRLGLEHRAWMLDGRGHEAGGHVYDCVYEEVVDLVRATAPARVSYTVDPSTFVEDPEVGLELRYDGAWWVSGIEAAGDGPATVEATSLAAQDAERRPVTIDEPGASDPQDGGDLCGENPGVRTGDTWRHRAVELEVIGEREPQDVLEVNLTRVATATIDLDGAGIAAGTPAEVAVTTDGPATLVLVGLEPGQVVHEGTRGIEADAEGRVEVTLVDGVTQLVVDLA